MLFPNAKIHRLSINGFLWLFTILLLTGALQLGAAPASAAAQLWARAIGPNTFQVDPPVCPASIGFGETIQCSITSAGEIDSYTFSANAGDKVLVRMSKASGTLLPGARIYSPDGAMLCEWESSTTAEIASCALTGTGTYTILAYDSFSGANTGDYYLHVQRLNNPGNATSIEFGQTLSGSILTPAEMDAYTFSASAGDRVLVRMSKASGTLLPGARIYSPDGTMLCEWESSTTAEIASCTLTGTGTYTILAYDSFSGANTGDYYLHVQRLNNPGNATSIEFGQTLSGSIVTPAEMDAYTFSANAGDKVLVRMSIVSGTLWQGVRVYSPDGTKLCEWESSTTAEIASCALTNTGTYTILAYDSYSGANTGNYYLHLQRLNNPGNATPIDFGQTLSGSILTPAEMDAYTFSASAGDKVLVIMSRVSGSLWPGIRIYGPDGTKVCEASSSATAKIASCTLPVTGAYTILVYDSYSGTYTGDYQLYFNHLTLYLPLLLK